MNVESVCLALVLSWRYRLDPYIREHPRYTQYLRRHHASSQDTGQLDVLGIEQVYRSACTGERSIPDGYCQRWLCGDLCYPSKFRILLLLQSCIYCGLSADHNSGQEILLVKVRRSSWVLHGY